MFWVLLTILTDRFLDRGPTKNCLKVKKQVLLFNLKLFDFF